LENRCFSSEAGRWGRGDKCACLTRRGKKKKKKKKPHAKIHILPKTFQREWPGREKKEATRDVAKVDTSTKEARYHKGRQKGHCEVNLALGCN